MVSQTAATFLSDQGPIGSCNRIDLGFAMIAALISTELRRDDVTQIVNNKTKVRFPFIS
jgi:hypothetical protein